MREDKRVQKREQIAQAAYGLIETKGYAGTSMLAIAKAAKASNETLYAWYGDKLGLFRALVDDNAGLFADRIAAQAADGPPLAALEAVGAGLLEMLLGPRAVALNQAAAADATGALGQAIAQGGRDRVAPLLMDLIGRALDQGELSGEPSELTERFLSLLIGDQQIRRVIGVMPVPSTGECRKRSGDAVGALRTLHPGRP